MIFKKQDNALSINSSFSSFSYGVGEDKKIDISAGYIIGSSGHPIQISGSAIPYDGEPVFLQIRTNPSNNEVEEVSTTNKTDFAFQDESFYYPVLLFKNDRNVSINNDIVYQPEEYGNINVQLIDDLTIEPEKFIVKVSNFSFENTLFSNSGERNLYINRYVGAEEGVKILGTTVTNSTPITFGDLELISSLDQDRSALDEPSYFLPLAIIDTEKRGVTILY